MTCRVCDLTVDEADEQDTQELRDSAVLCTAFLKGETLGQEGLQALARALYRLFLACFESYTNVPAGAAPLTLDQVSCSFAVFHTR